jgi:hypothetical protein
MLIGISGKAGSGKDTLAAAINAISAEKFQVRRFSGKLKLIAELLTGIPADTMNDQDVKNARIGSHWGTMTLRELLVLIGQDMRDRLHPDVWVNALFADFDDRRNWIVPDVRYSNEMKAIKDRGGIVIRVDRPAISYVDHPSETELDSAEFDLRISNTGTRRELFSKAFEFLIGHESFRVDGRGITRQDQEARGAA